MKPIKPLVALLCVEENSIQLIKNALLQKSSKFLFLIVQNKKELLEKSKWIPIDFIIFDIPTSEKCGRLFFKNFKFQNACIPLFLFSKNKTQQTHNELEKIVDDYFYEEEAENFYDKSISTLAKYAPLRIERNIELRKFHHQRLQMEKILAKVNQKKNSLLKTNYFPKNIFPMISRSMLN